MSEEFDEAMILKRMNEEERVIEVARRIWEIAAESPEAGNAVMDTLGEECYIRVMRLAAVSKKIVTMCAEELED